MQRREVAASSLLRLFLHVVQVDFEGRGPKSGFPRSTRPANRSAAATPRRRHRPKGRKNPTYSRNIVTTQRKKARNAQNLHRAREVQAAAQVIDLRAGDFRRVLEVLLLERAHQLGVRQKTVGVGQQNQRDGRKEQCGGRKSQFFHDESVFAELRSPFPAASGPRPQSVQAGPKRHHAGHASLRALSGCILAGAS